MDIDKLKNVMTQVYDEIILLTKQKLTGKLLVTFTFNTGGIRKIKFTTEKTKTSDVGG